MLQVSDAYKELVKSNIRPKCEPIIKVSGKDNNGQDIELTWRAKDIKDLTYKRGVDPIGRELPYMELTWTEIYIGKLDALNYPEKYNNVMKHMKVELSFTQNLSIFNTWKNVKTLTWKELKALTWKQVKNEVIAETVQMPTLYLEARPTIDGQTIKWTAKDILYFLTETQTKAFGYYAENDINVAPSIYNVLIYFILNARSGFLDSPYIFNALTEMATSLTQQANQPVPSYKIIGWTIFSDATKNLLRNLLAIYNAHWDFKGDYALPQSFEINQQKTLDYVYEFSGNVMSAFPKVTIGNTISLYSFKNYRATESPEEQYELEPSEEIPIFSEYSPQNKPLKIFYYKGFGIAYNKTGGKLSSANDEIDRFYSFSDDKIYVNPVSWNEYDNNISSAPDWNAYADASGIVFDENNPLNIHNANSGNAKARFRFLTNYFKKGYSDLEFSGLPNISLEPSDVIKIETNLYDNDNRISKLAIITSIEYTYSGTLQTKINAHEVFLE
jgi:hypothetical protein